MVEETTETTGTGSLVLAGATANHRTFASAFSENDYVPYMLRASDGGLEWGYGKAVDLAGTPDLQRSFVHGSTNAGALLNLPAGEHTVSCGILPDLRQRRGLLYTDPAVTGSHVTTVPTGSLEKIYWGTELDDTDDHFSPWLSDIIVPAYVDKVRVVCQLTLNTNNTTGVRRLKIRASDGTYPAGHGTMASPGSDYTFTYLMITSGVIELLGTPGVDKGIYIEIWQNSGIGLDLNQTDSGSWVYVEFVE